MLDLLGHEYRLERDIHPSDISSYMKERFDVPRETQIVNFGEKKELTDPVKTDACVRVCTSDGRIGTLSHLSVGANPEQFAIDLRTLVETVGIPVVLGGGKSDWPPSVLLTRRLFKALKDNGFKVSEDSESSDVLGLYTRAGTLQKDGVWVTRTPYCDNPISEKLFLKFPM